MTVDHVQCLCSQSSKEDESKALRYRRVDPIKGSVGSGIVDPFGAAVGEKTTPRLRELSACISFRTLQTPGEGQVRKYHLVGLWYTVQAVIAKRLPVFALFVSDPIIAMQVLLSILTSHIARIPR